MQALIRAVLLCVLGLTNLNAYGYGIYESHPYEFLIKKTVSRFSEKYIISAPSQTTSTYPATYTGAIKKSSFRLRTNYDLSDQNGWQATGITRMASLGSIYPWATDIDIYDTRKVQIGFIDGNIATFESARFDIYSYDEAGKATQVGVALANADFTHFSINTPGNSLPIADFTRQIKADSWTVTVSSPGNIDDRIIRIFAGFVMNYQDKFMANPKI